jgi:DNA-binding winged helix-turn-helix (wHTH) protein/Tol biopolymer transport system component
VLETLGETAERAVVGAHEVAYNPAAGWGTSMALQIVRFGLFEVDRSANQLLKRGRPVKLAPQPLKVLLLLLDRYGQVVSRSDIQRHLWGDSTFVDFERGINFSINQIRVALGDDPEKPRYIETLPKLGYRFVGEVTHRLGTEPVVPAPRGVVLESNLSDTSAHQTHAPDLQCPPGSDEFVRLPSVAASVPKENTAGQNGTNVYVRVSEGVSGSQGGVSGRLTGRRYVELAVVLLAAFVGIAIFVRYIQEGRAAPTVAQGMRLTKLTQNGTIREMAISPDGRYLTFALREGPTQSLWLREVPSGNDLQLLAPDTVNFSGLEFSPDGASIYFVRSERTNPSFSYLCKMPSAGGSVDQLIRDADSPVSFSPDGKRFVYTRGYPSRDITEVRIAERDGANDHALLDIPGHQVYEAGATWSPNNKSIAVPIRVIGEASRFILYVISLTSARATELYSWQGAIGRPMWLGSGDRLLVTLEDVRTHRGQLWTISYPDGEARRLTNDLSDYSSAIDVTNDGTKLAAIVTDAVSNLWTAGADDLSRVAQVTSGEPSLFQIRALPDRRLIALGSDVWVMDGDASHRTRFGQVDDPRSIEACRLSVLILRNKDSITQVARFGLDGSGAAVITAGDVLSPVCSPDEKFVYYLNFKNTEKIQRISTQDGSIADVANVLGDTAFGNLTISPAGNWLAYPYQQYSPPLVALAVLSSKGGPPIKQFQVPGFLGRIRWSPKGDALQYLKTQEGATNLWEQRLEGGRPKQLTHFSVGQIFDFDWSHDQKRLLMTRGQVTRDVVFIENFQSSR